MSLAETKRVAKAERLINDAPRTFTEADFPVGTVAHQGDLILVRIAALPQLTWPRHDRQLAAGNTQGSRHVLQIGACYDCPSEIVAAAISAACKGVSVDPWYCGPVFQTVGGAADLLHPEHGHHHYRGEMTVAVVYQRNIDAEEQERRVQD